jgi:hypothetical protein
MRHLNEQHKLHPVTRENQTKRRRCTRGLLLAALVSLVTAGCASLPASDGPANGCVGPASFCNPFFGS